MTQSRPYAASLALVVGTRVLLVQRALPPMAGLWTLPGGRLEPGETAEMALCREISEELGLVLDAPHHLLDFEAQPGWAIAVFRCRVDQAPAIKANEEILRWQWTTPTGLEKLETTPGLAQVVAQAFSWAER